MLNLHIPRWLTRVTGQDREDDDVDPKDTVMRWPPTATRLLASTERHAHKCIAKALTLEHPHGFLLAHVPLHKLVKVPKQNSYREWLSRTGLLTVDFALCDEHGFARVVVLMPLADDQPRLVRRRERLLRVLEATDLAVTLWDRDWVGDESEQLRGKLFTRPRSAGYFVDRPHAH